MKKLKKMGLAGMKSELTRKEMRNIMAGSGTGSGSGCPPSSCGDGGTCYFWIGEHLTSGCSCFKNNAKITGTC